MKKQVLHCPNRIDGLFWKVFGKAFEHAGDILRKASRERRCRCFCILNFYQFLLSCIPLYELSTSAVWILPMPCRATVEPPRTLFSHACVHWCTDNLFKIAGSSCCTCTISTFLILDCAQTSQRCWVSCREDIRPGHGWDCQLLLQLRSRAIALIFKIEMLRSLLPQWSVQTGIVRVRQVSCMNGKPSLSKQRPTRHHFASTSKSWMMLNTPWNHAEQRHWWSDMWLRPTLFLSLSLSLITYLPT